MKIQLTIFSLALILMFSGCEETVLLDLDQTPERVVIQGQVTDVPGYQFVRVTKSADFYTKGSTKRVSNAVVIVTDNTGEKTTFSHNPRGHADSTGYYVPATGFVGKVGRTYTLSVQLDGQTYTGADILNRVTKLDALDSRPNDFDQRNPPSNGKDYELLIYAKEPQDTKDYYLIKYYRNDSLVYQNKTDVYIFDDYGVGEDIAGVPSSVHYAVGDKAVVEMYSLTRDAYLYYSDLVNILNSDGGMFSPPPANPRTNISGGALGLFQVSAKTSIGTVVKKPD